MRREVTIFTAGLFALAIIIAGCGGVQLRPTGPATGASGAQQKQTTVGESQVVFKFFEEQFMPGGYEYAYPDESKVWIPEESGNRGEVALQFDLVAGDFSGGAVCLYNMLYDMTPYVATGALQFWIKGKNGGEIAIAALADDEANNGVKTVVRAPINQYGGITNEWTKVSIPLADFGRRGVYWDARQRIEVPETFQWDKVAEFRLEIKANENSEFTAWVEDIFIVSNVYEAKDIYSTVDWDEREEVLPNIPTSNKPAVKDMRGAQVLNDGLNVRGGFNYVYGGKTAHQVQKTENGTSVLAAYMDASQYAGVTISIGEGNFVNLASARTGDGQFPNAGIAFWGRGSENANRIFFGLLDNQGNNAQGVEVKTQSVVLLGDHGRVSTEWRYYMIPIRDFPDVGRYWNQARGVEVTAPVDWSKIQEIRFSVSRDDYLGKIQEGDPVTFYVSGMTFIDEIPGHVNRDDFWKAFRSDAPDILLHNFATEGDRNWETSRDEKSEVAFKFVESGNPEVGEHALEITYRLRSWADVTYEYKDNKRPAEHRNWTKHWGLMFHLYTDKPYQPIVVQLRDSGNEVFDVSTGGTKGWTEILVPFKDFNKFAHWQPDDAVETGKLKLDSMRMLNFKAAGEGSRGTFRVANVRLTNLREAKTEAIPAELAVQVQGSFDKDNVVTKKINPGIFGINVALWDGDLLLPATVEYVKAVKHHVLRYPGGLRADDDDWEKVLAAKDWMVDTDQFFKLLKDTETEGMITVNFGSGTPELAARWVAHAKAWSDKNNNGVPIVKLWEIGNELYGDWHAFHTTGDDYGKRAREFAVQMKAADPKALVTAVWTLEGEWNQLVFNHVKDVIDGVNVHHYPQTTGQENDAGLLASPQTLDDIMPAVKRQLAEYGASGKNYQIWLTEWNSVDFRPGPQTMTIVNALFVADYLGMLTHHNIEQASYWDVHNDVTPEGGDYGYLSRTGALDGCNVPRSSYWAFKMASHSLGRGSLFKTETSRDNITSYLTECEKQRSIMLINKYPRTVANVTLNIPGFEGSATKQVLTPENSGSPGVKGAGPTKTTVNAKPDMTLSLPAHSITTITIKK